MGKLDVQSTVTLILNGEQTKTSLKEVTQAVNATTAALANMKKADDPKAYQEKIELLGKLKESQAKLRQEIMNGNEAQKGFFSDFKKGFGELEEMAGKITIGTLIYKGINLAIEGVKDLFNGAVEAYNEAVKTQTQLQQVVKTTGGVAGETTEKLEKYQKGLMDQTGVDDDVIAKGEEMLLTFTNIRGKIYDQALPAIVDMTAALNGGKVTMEGIQSTAILVGKGLNDPIKGMTAWQKAGVSLNEQQKQQITTMVKSNDLMGAQSILLNELQKEFGGTAQAINNTDVGAAQKFATRIDNIKESIGAFITRMKNLNADALDPFVSLIEKATETTLPEKLHQEQDEMNSLVGAIVSCNDNQAVRNQLITELQQKYPDFIGLIDKERVTNQMLLQQLSAVNEQYRIKIFMAANEDKMKDIAGERNKAIREEAEARERVAKASGLSQEALAKLTDEQVRNMAQQITANKLAHDKQSMAMGGAGSAPGAVFDIHAFQDAKDLDLILNGRKRIEDSFKEEADLMAANGVYQKKLTDEEVANIDKQIAAIKKRMATEKEADQDNDKRDLKRLEQKRKEALGIVEAPTSGPTKADQDAAARNADAEKKAREDYLAQSKALDEKLREFNQSELADTLSKNDKEVAALESKYDKEWTEATAALTKLRESKNANETKIQQQQDAIDALAGKKSQAVADLRVRQEKELTDKISAFRDKMAGRLETELDKETNLINQYYDGLSKDAGDNQQQQEEISVARGIALNDAKLRNAKLFQEAVDQVAAEGAVTAADKDKIELARINKKYDDEVEALVKKFGKEQMATKEGVALIAEINKNRKNEIGQKDADNIKKNQVAELKAAETVADAVFTISNNNRKAETDAKIKDLETQKDKELSNENLTAAQRTAITNKYAKQEADIKLKAWKADQAAAMETAAIKGALALLTNLAETGIFSFATDGLIIAETAAQIAVIAAQKPPQFAKGGIMAGPSHAEGGIDLVNAGTGQPVANVEGGETVAVFSKAATQNNQMLINELLYNSQYRNGAPVRINTSLATRPATGVFANGGYIDTKTHSGQSPAGNAPAMPGFDMGALVDEMRLTRQAIKDQQVTLNYQYFKKEIDKNVRLENNSKA